MKAIIYCKVSTEEQTKNLSLPTQEKACVEYCRKNGLEVDRIFREEGESAKTADRTELKNLLAYCRKNKGRIQYLVVYNISRLSRNAADYHAIKAQLARDGVNLRSVTEPIDETPMGKLMATIMSSLHQLDNDMQADRTMAGMKAALELGRWTFQAPLGYSNLTQEDGTRGLIPDPERAALVKKAFKLYSTGCHTRPQVLKMVTDLGLRSRKGKKVSIRTFNKLLLNPLYAGWVKVASWGIMSRGKFKPLVTQEVFDKVQTLHKAR